MKWRWFLFFFKKSISQRKGRIVIASLSVMLAVAVVTALIGLTSGIKEKLGSELKAYGANIIVSPLKSDYLDYDALDNISKLNNVEESSGQVLGKAFIDRQAIEIIGLDVNRLKDKGWRLYGNWPENKGEILAGINLKEVLKLEKGKVVQLTSETSSSKDILKENTINPPSPPFTKGGMGGLSDEGRKRDFVVSGFIEKGGSEDKSLIMSIPEAWELTGMERRLNAILVRGKSGELDNIVRGIKDNIPAATVKTLRQVAFAEESLLVKIQLLMVLVTIVVLFATAISVASTMGANVLERREEIGLMKAIGATRNGISSFYMTEALLIGFLGGASGFLFGYIAAQAVSKGAFNSFINIPLFLPFFSISTGLAISVLSGYFPVRDAMKYDPAVILRGE